MLPSSSLRFHQTLTSPILLRPTPLPSITMRDRSKNRKPLQKGRHLSIEAIQAAQALKRASADHVSLQRVLRSNVQRLIKFDMMALLAELQRQNRGALAFQVYEEVRREHWYNPQFSVYNDMIKVLANNDLLEKVEVLVSYLKRENFKADVEGFNALLDTLLKVGFVQDAKDCFDMMSAWKIEPDQFTFRILIGELEAKGDVDTASMLRDQAKYYFGSLDFLEEREDDEFAQRI